MSPDELSELLSRCALKDQRAFSKLYRASSAKLFAVAVRITRRRDWAEEVLQESYVNIWHHAAGYDATKSSPMTWMTAVVRNRSLDWLRRPRNVESDTDQEALIAGIADDNPGPEQLFARSAEAARLVQCLGDLTSDQRRSITLAFFYGMSHSELAHRLGKPLGTVKTWIRRGLEKLKACLSGLDTR